MHQSLETQETPTNLETVDGATVTEFQVVPLYKSANATPGDPLEPTAMQKLELAQETPVKATPMMDMGRLHVEPSQLATSLTLLLFCNVRLRSTETQKLGDAQDTWLTPPVLSTGIAADQVATCVGGGDPPMGGPGGGDPPMGDTGGGDPGEDDPPLPGMAALPRPERAA
jgi:hypothetical protein